MKKSFFALIIGVCLTLLGGILFTISMTAHGWNFSALSNSIVEYESYQSENLDINKLSVNFSIADISLNEYDGENITVEYPVFKNRKGEPRTKVTVTEENQTLSIVESHEWQKWLFQIYTPTATVKINIPKGLNLNLSLEVSTGDIKLGEIEKEYNFSSL